MDKTLEQFYKNCMEEISIAQEENLSGWQTEDFLTELIETLREKTHLVRESAGFRELRL